MNLMERLKAHVEAAPIYSSPSKWAAYKRYYFFLINKRKYPPKKALEYMNEVLNLSEEDFTKLYNASKSWTR